MLLCSVTPYIVIITELFGRFVSARHCAAEDILLLPSRLMDRGRLQFTPKSIVWQSSVSLRSRTASTAQQGSGNGQADAPH